jgi:hypothetical protein
LAQVEDRLDWQFSLEGTTRVWTRRDEGKGYRLAVDANGTAIAEKTMDSGRKTRITEYCKTGITSREIRNFLGET